jgi:hypothetical protein
MFHLILFALGALVLYRLAVLLFWCAAYVLIQPVRLLLWAL